MCLKRKVLLEAATLEAFRSGAKLGAFVMDEEAVQVAVWDDAAEEFVALTRLEQVPSKARLSLSVPTGRRGFGSQLAGVGAPRGSAGGRAGGAGGTGGAGAEVRVGAAAVKAHSFFADYGLDEGGFERVLRKEHMPAFVPPYCLNVNPRMGRMAAHDSIGKDDGAMLRAAVEAAEAQDRQEGLGELDELEISEGGGAQFKGFSFDNRSRGAEILKALRSE